MDFPYLFMNLSYTEKTFCLFFWVTAKGKADYVKPQTLESAFY